MTLADRIEGVLRELGDLPVCVIATSLRKRKAEVIAALNGNPHRFVHNGRSARASRWGLREVVNGVDDEKTFTVDDLAALWRPKDIDEVMARSFTEYWIAEGYLKSVDGNGTIAVTEIGRQTSQALIAGQMA